MIIGPLKQPEAHQTDEEPVSQLLLRPLRSILPSRKA